jgi:hypothetical protein
MWSVVSAAGHVRIFVRPVCSVPSMWKDMKDIELYNKVEFL